MSMRLWRHQQDMVDWLAARGGSGLLAAEMGTGKTATAVEATRSDRRVLVVCPPAVGPAWQKQLGIWDAGRRFIDGVNGSVVKRAERLKSALASGTRFTFVVNYEAVWREPLAAVVRAAKWDAIILDESHKVKAPMGKASRWLYDLAQRSPGAKRIAMTGTPMPQSPLDIFAQGRFIDPTIFGTSSVRFRNRYADCDPRFPSKVRKYINTDELTAKVDSFTFRVASDDVLDLPEAIHETVPVSLSKKTMRAYDELEATCVAYLQEHQGQVFTPHTLTKLLRLAQITGGYAPVDRGDGMPPLLVLLDGMPAKSLALEELMDGLPVMEPIVVFARFAADLIEIGAAASRMGRSYSELSGRDSARGGLAAWQDGLTTVLGVQLQSGGVGIDLTRANYCVYWSKDFSLGNYDQSLARVRRPGQTRTCFYYHLCAVNTIDEEITAALMARRNVVEAVVSKLTKRVEVIESEQEVTDVIG